MRLAVQQLYDHATPRHAMVEYMANNQKLRYKSAALCTGRIEDEPGRVRHVSPAVSVHGTAHILSHLTWRRLQMNLVQSEKLKTAYTPR